MTKRIATYRHFWRNIRMRARSFDARKMKAAQERRTPRRFALADVHWNSRQRLGVRRCCAALEGDVRVRKELFEELLESITQARAIERNEARPSRVFVVKRGTEVARVRKTLGLSQSKFAALLGISANTLKNWEQGRRRPTGPARVLLNIAARYPKVILEAAA